MLNFNEKSVLPNDRDLWGRGQDRSESKALNKELRGLTLGKEGHPL